MKRREFLKGLSVAASVAAVPVLAENKLVAKSLGEDSIAAQIFNDKGDWNPIGDASVSKSHIEYDNVFEGGYLMSEEASNCLIKELKGKS